MLTQSEHHRWHIIPSRLLLLLLLFNVVFLFKFISVRGGACDDGTTLHFIFVHCNNDDYVLEQISSWHQTKYKSNCRRFIILCAFWFIIQTDCNIQILCNEHRKQCSYCFSIIFLFLLISFKMLFLKCVKLLYLMIFLNFEILCCIKHILTATDMISLTIVWSMKEERFLDFL